MSTSRLGVSYGGVQALSDVDLAVAPGEIVAITGEPGAGTSTLLRCLAGDITPDTGEVRFQGRPRAQAPSLGAHDVGVVWQQAELCMHLDVAGNLLLGRETPRLMLFNSRFHAAASEILRRLRIPIEDTTTPVGRLTAGERQMIAIARAVSGNPGVLLLDEPTGTLGALETRQVEELITDFRNSGAAVLIASRDVDQVLRLADRVIVMRHGRVVVELDPAITHRDDVAAIQAGQEIDASARRQLTRLHGLADRLVSADPSSSMPLILSALGAALGIDQLCIHVIRDELLMCEASLGFTPELMVDLAQLPIGSAGGPPGVAAASGESVVVEPHDAREAWGRCPTIRRSCPISGSWSVPVVGPDGLIAVITVLRSQSGPPDRDALDLLTLYASYAASALERDGLLAQVTARNRVLESIQEVLETLAGPVSVEVGLAAALQSLRRGLQADEVALVTGTREGTMSWRAFAGRGGPGAERGSEQMQAAVARTLALARRDGVCRGLGDELEFAGMLAVAFDAPGGPTALVARWEDNPGTEVEIALMEDASHTLNLALEREQAGIAYQEAAALRRSRELQRGFLSRLSHELRTPLTAIRGYASSLMQTDVTWDGDSQQRFLDRIAAESARVGRLIDDLLDFSAIESGVMRLQPDWCELRLIIDAAVACLPSDWAECVSVECDAALPPVCADHDRLEQVFVNLLNNALKHNPPGTRVTVRAALLDQHRVGLVVSDNGVGLPPEMRGDPFTSTGRRRSATAGAGLGLSIAKGIIDAHRGTLEVLPAQVGVSFRIVLPIETLQALADHPELGSVPEHPALLGAARVRVPDVDADA